MSVHAPSKAQPKDLPAGVAVSDEPKPTVDTAPIYKGYAKDGSYLELCLPHFRPPGAIADQATAGVGVWARIPGQTWVKTPHKAEGKVITRIHKGKTAAEGLTFLLEP